MPTCIIPCPISALMEAARSSLAEGLHVVALLVRCRGFAIPNGRIGNPSGRPLSATQLLSRHR
jgi:hypothetical protein